MKRYDKKGEIEQITAKMILGMTRNLLYSIFPKDTSLAIFPTQEYDPEGDILIESYRVDLGDIGTFVVKRSFGTIEIERKNNNWVLAEGQVYEYESCSKTYNGSPYLSIEKAYDYMTNLKDNLP